METLNLTCEHKKSKSIDDLVENIGFAVLTEGLESSGLVKSYEVFDKEVALIDALTNKDLARSYWLLDKNAFGGLQPAPIFMKLDALILGGLPIIMTLPIEKTNQALVSELEAQNLDYVPIAFMDLHFKGDGKFAVSGLGISKQYQGMGLSKLMIYGGIKIAGIKQLVIPTQLSNSAAHFAWLHLSPLEVVCADVFHNEPDTIIYKAEIPNNPESILNIHPQKSDLFLPFNRVKSYCSNKHGVKVIGYVPGDNGGLYLK